MGIQINGQTDTITAIDGTMTLPGTVTYEDVSRVNVTGIVTAGQGLHVTGGSVGIGTDNPSKKLDIRTDTVEAGIVLNSSGRTLVMTTQEQSGVSQAAKIGTTSNHELRIITNDEERLRVDSTGAIRQTLTSFDSVYNGVITADSPTFVAENQTTDTYYRLTGGTYGNASSVSLDLSTHRAKNKGTTSSFRIKNYTGTTGSVADPKLAFITTRFETDDTTITEVATKLELTTSGIRVPHKLYSATTSGNTGNTRTLTLDNIEEGTAYLVTLTRSPSLGNVSIYQTLIRYDGNGNFEGNDDIVNTTPGNMTITYGNASGGTATLTYVNGGTQRFRVTVLRVN